MFAMRSRGNSLRLANSLCAMTVVYEVRPHRSKPATVNTMCLVHVSLLATAYLYSSDCIPSIELWGSAKIRSRRDSIIERSEHRVMVHRAGRGRAGGGPHARRRSTTTARLSIRQMRSRPQQGRMARGTNTAAMWLKIAKNENDFLW